MARVENKNAPNLMGWVLAAMIASVALVAAIVVGGFDLTPAVVIAGALFVVVGLIAGMPRAPLPAPGTVVIKVPPAPVAGGSGMAVKTAAILGVTPASAPVAPIPAAPVVAPAPDGGPLRLATPRNGTADNLKEIEGIGPALEKLCNSLGFYHFDQIASWTDADVAWVDESMAGFKGRIVRDKWVAQARLIVSEGLEAFRVRAKTNDY